MNLQNLSKNKPVLIIGFLILCIIIAGALYFLFFKSTTPPIPDIEEDGITGDALPISGEREPGEGDVTTPDVQIPTGPEITRDDAFEPSTQVSDIARGDVTKITNLDGSKTDFIKIDSTGNKLLAYNKESGAFYKIDEEGNKVSLSGKTFKNVSDIAWAPESEKAILEFPDGSNVYYDFKNDKQVTLPKDWTEFGFNSTENQIAFKDMNSNVDKRFLGTSNPDGSNAKYIEYIGGEDHNVTVKWSPTNQIAATYATGSNADYSKIYFIGQNKENFRSIDANGYNVEYDYTPTGSHIVYSAQNSLSGHKPVLYAVEASGDRIGYGHTNLKLQTWPDKCTFSNDTTMYCAVPKEMPDGAGWFPELTDNIGDNIYKVNIATGSVSFVAQPQYEYNIEQMQVSENGETLFFTDKFSQTLHKMQLK